MANPKHLKTFKKGVTAWNEWRKQNFQETPNFSGANFIEAKLRGADLSRADLIEANLIEADLSGANLSGAYLSGANLIEANLRGADLGSADLVEANLIEADLSGADLGGANLSRAILIEANLGGANLAGADLSGANLSRAILIEANLNGAKLSRADLSRANLSGTDLSGADLSGAIMAYTALGALDLSAVKGLQSVDHIGPSTIGIDTVYKSNGEIPEAFLRGAGIPDGFIAGMKSLAGVALELCSCFISYSTKDQDFADRLHADLQSKGVRCWFARHDTQGGKKIHEPIDEAKRVYDKLLLILSDASMASEWVKAEIAHARHKETDQGRRVLFPITLVNFSEIKQWKSFDAEIGADLARGIREYYIPDFTNWNSDHVEYKKEFECLLRDLQLETARRDRT